MSGWSGGWQGGGSLPAAVGRIPPEFIGISTHTLWRWFRECQEAMQALTVGGKAEVVSYAQGDGSKSVTYTRAQLGLLEERTRQLAKALGLVGRRRAITVSF